jgi:glycosyltransferase involved in cell wall biosynthesis
MAELSSISAERPAATQALAQPASAAVPTEVNPLPPGDIRLLLATAETHPTHRADVRVLFGKYLPRSGILSDLVAVSLAEASTPGWGGGKLLTRRAATGIGKVAADLWLQLSLLWKCGQGYDGLVVRDKPFLGLIGLLACRLSGIPFMYWMSFPVPELYLSLARDPEGRETAARRVYAWLRGRIGALVLYRLLLPGAAHLFVQSPAMASDMLARRVPESKITVVPMGVDLDITADGQAAIKPADWNRESAVYLGTLCPSRRHELEVMVDAAKIVGSRRPGFCLTVIGEADRSQDKGWLKAYAERTGAAPWVRFTGWIANDEAMQIARRCAIGVSAVPRGELYDKGTPTKAIEYMALGLPVVCNDQLDQAWIIAESAGGLCVSLTPDAFAEAIVSLLDKPEQALRMGEAGRRWTFANRGYDRIAESVCTRLRQVIGRRHAIARTS